MSLRGPPTPVDLSRLESVTLEHGAYLPPGGAAALAGVLAHRRLQEEQGKAEEEEEKKERDEEDTCKIPMLMSSSCDGRQGAS